MKKIYLALVTLCFAFPLRAEIQIQNPYVPELPPSSAVYAAYLSITNLGSETRTLIGTTAQGFKMTHLHESIEKDGVISMNTLHHLMIEPGETISLKPGGLHLMLMRPQDDAFETRQIALTLTFKNGETIAVQAPLQALN